ncbi:MAG: XRE family transcriptional regulator [Gammaproteobacteria bacterium]
MIGERIKQARKASGLSQRGLAERAGISAMAVSKYENNQSVPSSNVLLQLAQALGVRAEYFFRTTQVELREVEYRKHTKLPKKVLVRIEGDIKEQIERYLELEEILPNSLMGEFRLPDNLPPAIKSYDEIEEIAVRVRNEWNLGRDPIPDLTGALEERGVRVFQTEAQHDGKFDGLACSVNGAPVIVVGQDWPGDRQRFTLAHELGHLILADRINNNLDIERAANRFAGAFLAPDSEVYKELGEKRSWFEPYELCVLKKAYGLSMGGWLHRARDLKIIPQSTYQEIYRYFNQRGWHKQEPCDEYPREEPQVFKQLVFHALAEDFISESKAAELMRMAVVEFRSIRNVDHGKQAVNQ